MHQNAVKANKPYESILVNDFSPGDADARRRHKFMKQIAVPVRCIKFTYSGSKEHLVLIWKVDNSDSEILFFQKIWKFSQGYRKICLYTIPSNEKRVCLKNGYMEKQGSSAKHTDI